MSREIVNHFLDTELRCKCGNPKCMELPAFTPSVMEFLNKISALRDTVGPLTVTSYYRCPYHPLTAASPGSSHAQGLAIDLSPGSIDVVRLYLAAEKMGFNGIGISQIGISFAQFVHLDMKQGRLGRWKYLDATGAKENYLFAIKI